MTQADLNREVASCTGETVATIRKRGFSLIEPHYPPPLVLDWDKLDSRRLGVVPNPQRRRRVS
jgi:hypothetical protein